MLEDPTKGEETTKDPEGGEANTNDPQTGDAAGTEQPTGEDTQSKDPSGSSTVNRSKYDADIRRRDKTIAELKKQLAELTESKAASGDETAKLRADFEAYKSATEREKAELKLGVVSTAPRIRRNDPTRLRFWRPSLCRLTKRVFRSWPINWVKRRYKTHNLVKGAS